MTKCVEIQVKPISLAFLHNITSVNIYFDNIANPKRRIEKKSGQKLIIESKDQTSPKNHYYWTVLDTFDVDPYLKEDSRIKDKGRADIKQREVILAFLLNENGTFKNDLQPYYVFLPTKQETGLKFIIQTDFIVDTSRNSLDESLEWNSWLIRCARQVLWKAVEEFKNDQKLRYNFYSILLPHNSNNILIKNHLVEPFVKESETRDIVLNSNEEWKKPSEVVWAAKLIQEIIPINILSSLTGKSYYVHPDVMSSGKDFLKKVGVKEYDEYSLILGVLKNKEWLKAQPQEWFNIVYEYLLDKLFNEKRWTDWHTRKEEIEKIEIVKDKAGNLQKPTKLLFDQPTELQFPLESLPDIKFVDESDLSDKSKKFLQEMGVKNVEPDSIVSTLLRGYNDGSWEEWRVNERITCIQFIEKWWLNNKQKNMQIQSNIESKFGSIRILCENKNWEPAEVCYFQDSILKEILPNAKFIENSLYNKDFLKHIGVGDIPKVIKVGNKLPFNEKNSLQHWDTYLKWNELRNQVGYVDGKFDVYCLDGFEEDLSSEFRMIQYLQFLVDHWEYYKNFLKRRYYYVEKSSRNWYETYKDVFSYFAFQIKGLAWLPTTNGLEKASETVFIETDKIKNVASNIPFYLKMPINEETIKSGFFREIGLTTELDLKALLLLLRIIGGRKDIGIDETLKNIISRIYKDASRKIDDSNYSEYLKNINLLAEESGKLSFYPIKQIYWNDVPQIGEEFKDILALAWIPEKLNRDELFEFFKISKLSENIEISYLPEHESERKDERLSKVFAERAKYFLSLMHYYKVEEKKLSFFDHVEVYQVDKIQKVIKFGSFDPRKKEDLAFCDLDNNRIYRVDKSNCWDLALKIAEKFEINDISRVYFINSLLNKKSDEIKETFQKMHILILDITDIDEIKDVKVKPFVIAKEENKTGDNQGQGSEPIDEHLSEERIEDYVNLANVEKIKETIVENEIFETSDGTVEINTEESSVIENIGTISTDIKMSHHKKTKERKKVLSDLTVEGLARELVHRYEHDKNRDSWDAKHGCGWDIYSKSKDGKEERYIEVKGSKSDQSSFSITYNELQKAKELQNRYFIYRVIYVKSKNPEIYIINNPDKQLTITEEPIFVVKNWRQEFKKATRVQFTEKESASSIMQK